MRKIAIYGGTFNPPHKAHLKIAKQVISANLADIIIFLPAANPPHKLNDTILAFQHRTEMLKLMVADFAKFIISNIENQRKNLPSYTYVTMNELSKQYPNDKLMLLIGEDSLKDLHLWMNANKLVEKWDFIIYPRKESKLSEKILINIWGKDNTNKLLKSLTSFPEHNMSSTFIRKQVQNQDNLKEFLDTQVINYIKTHNLYLN